MPARNETGVDSDAGMKVVGLPHDLEHSHRCGVCHHEYTPAQGQSEDCPACGYDGEHPDTSTRSARKEATIGDVAQAPFPTAAFLKAVTVREEIARQLLSRADWIKGEQQRGRHVRELRAREAECRWLADRLLIGLSLDAPLRKETSRQALHQAVMSFASRHDLLAKDRQTIRRPGEYSSTWTLFRGEARVAMMALSVTNGYGGGWHGKAEFVDLARSGSLDALIEIKDFGYSKNMGSGADFCRKCRERFTAWLQDPKTLVQGLFPNAPR